ncbi:hypothetical protein RhiirC2_784962 [Rhizophagus irregularis]|uniref:Uncharacterized protein n=1 Tax=Rhizophagus irregularis TaxID=588596 RepID=A0A2N1MXF6_9GLOM|nr:hypothetical protein RhiirC2_784962 [Rhizophagus irregularis]
MKNVLISKGLEEEIRRIRSDIASEFGGINDPAIKALRWKANKPSNFAIKDNFKHITDSLGWYTDVPVTLKNKEDKMVTVQGVSNPNKNQFRIKLHGKAYIIPTFSKSPVVKNLPKKDQESLCKVPLDFQVSANSSNSEEDLKKSFSEHICQLEDEVRELKNQIIYKDISFSKVENEISTKLKEIQAFQLEIKELEMKYFLVQKDLSEMDSLRRELALSRQNVELKNVDLDLKEDELSKKKSELMRLKDELTLTQIELMDKKEKLMQMKDNLSSVQKTLSEKEILLQEANDHLAEHIHKIKIG